MAKTASDRTKRSAAAGRSGTAGQRPSLQVGALCWRRTRKGALRILLITSRDTGRWVIPKGWPMRRRTEQEAAAREAWEEAGIRGEIAQESLGLYAYPKVMPNRPPVPCLVRVYPLEVSASERDFPEVGQRRLKWFAPAKAARRVQEPELARIIRAFSADWTRSTATAAELDAQTEGSGGSGLDEHREPDVSRRGDGAGRFIGS